MATLSFRLPANRQQHAVVRHAAWSRVSASMVAQAGPPRSLGLARVTELAPLQPPTGPSMIELPSRAAARTTTEDVVATGWFDSTWELQQGLEISEGLPTDLPLGDWLKLYLAD